MPAEMKTEEEATRQQRWSPGKRGERDKASAVRSLLLLSRVTRFFFLY